VALVDCGLAGLACNVAPARDDREPVLAAAVAAPAETVAVRVYGWPADGEEGEEVIAVVETPLATVIWIETGELQVKLGSGSVQETSTVNCPAWKTGSCTVPVAVPFVPAMAAEAVAVFVVPCGATVTVPLGVPMPDAEVTETAIAALPPTAAPLPTVAVISDSSPTTVIVAIPLVDPV
jgi:hypothetical protein